MHTMKSESSVCITPWNQTTSKCPFSCFRIQDVFQLCLSKNVFSKKDSLKNLWRHYREITIIKFRIKTDTWQVTDSTVWCTPRGLTPGMMHTAEFLYTFFMTLLCDAHRRTWLRGGMHTAELDSMEWCTPGSLTQQYDAHAQWCTPQSFLKIRISRQNRNRIRKFLTLFIRGPDGFESWKIWKSKLSWHTPFNMETNLQKCRTIQISLFENSEPVNKKIKKGS